MPRHTDYPCNPASAAVQTEVPMTPASNRRHVLRALEARNMLERDIVEQALERSPEVSHRGHRHVERLLELCILHPTVELTR